MKKGLTGKVISTVIVLMIMISGIGGVVFNNGEKSMLYTGIFIICISAVSFPLIWYKE